jgi:hypothetical protein
MLYNVCQSLTDGNTLATSLRSILMADTTYISQVRIVRQIGPKRLAYLPAESEPVVFGVHGAIAQHYGVSTEVAEPHATTLDYVVAAAGG